MIMNITYYYYYRYYGLTIDIGVRQLVPHDAAMSVGRDLLSGKIWVSPATFLAFA
jgi:hypothetical protein